MNKVNSWDEFQPLQELLVGSIYDSSFFDDVKEVRARDALKRIFDETQEDIDNFIHTMKSHNIKVYQASAKELGYKDSIMEYVNDKGELGYKRNAGEDRSRHDYSLYYSGIKGNLIPNPPLQPRDDCIVTVSYTHLTLPTICSV